MNTVLYPRKESTLWVDSQKGRLGIGTTGIFHQIILNTSSGLYCTLILSDKTNINKDLRVFSRDLTNIGFRICILNIVYSRGPESTSISGEIRESSTGKSANLLL